MYNASLFATSGISRGYSGLGLLRSTCLIYIWVVVKIKVPFWVP